MSYSVGIEERISTGCGHRRKARLLNFELIDAIGKTLHVEFALIVSCQRISILICLADNLNGRFHAKAGRIGHFEPQFAAIALRECRTSK